MSGVDNDNPGNVRNLIQRFETNNTPPPAKTKKKTVTESKITDAEKVIIPDAKQMSETPITAVSQEAKSQLKETKAKKGEEVAQIAETGVQSIAENRKLPEIPKAQVVNSPVAFAETILHETAKVNEPKKTIFLAQDISNNKRNYLSKTLHKATDFLQAPATRSLFAMHNRKLRDASFVQNIEKNQYKTAKTLENKINDINYRIADEKSKSTVNEKVIGKLTKELEGVEKKKAIFDKIKFYDAKGDEVREQMGVLGGESITINTPDNVNLDAMYLDAKKFRETLKNADSKLVTYQAKDGSQMQGILLSKENFESSGGKILNALKLLHGVADNKHPGAGWTTVKDGENILLVRSENIPRENNIGPFFDTKKYGMWELKAIESVDRTVEEINDTESSAGTVIVTTGNTGIYETSKDEALSFLFKNMNVVLFNFRGHGRSEGIPTQRGLNLDMESAYQLAVAKSGHPPEKILFKALCISGGPAAYVAGKHPETNIFLDQSYSSFRTLIKDQIRDELENRLLNILDDPKANNIANEMLKAVAYIISEAANLVLPFFIPNFDTAKSLAKNEGKKGLLITNEDEVIGVKHLQNNLKAISKNLEMHNTTVFSVPGKHGESILEVNASTLDYQSDEAKRGFEAFKKMESTAIEIELKSQLLIDDTKLTSNILAGHQKKLEAFKLEGLELSEEQQAEKLALEIKIATTKLQMDKRKVNVDKEIKELKGKIVELQNQAIELLPADLDIRGIEKKETIGQNMMSSFLKNAGLSNDIISA